MNASFEITPQKLAQNWQPKASSRQLEALMSLLQLAPELAWQNWRKIGVAKKKLAILGTPASFWSGQNGTTFNRRYSRPVRHYHDWLCRRHCLCARSAKRDRTGNRSR